MHTVIGSTGNNNSRRWIWSSVILTITLLAAAKPPHVLSSDAGGWSPTGSMHTARYEATATLLPNGKVLVAGGQNSAGGAGSALASAELYDPSNGTWSYTGSMSMARVGQTAVLLPNGKVLVAGGDNNVEGAGVLASAELYDPSSGAWSPTGSMAVARRGQAAVLLPNGKVLVAGGANYAPGVPFAHASAELYDPSSGAWSPTGSMAVARVLATATLLTNGKVLVAGGDKSGSAELYDPSSGAWSPTGSMTVVRRGQTAVLLPNGKVLVAGGITPITNGTVPFRDIFNAITKAELYDPSSGAWSPTGSMKMAIGLGGYSAALLVDGSVLVAGGSVTQSITGHLPSAEIYKPSSGTWSLTHSMAVAQYIPTATLLPNGNVLIAGGFKDNQRTPVVNAEVYQGPAPSQPLNVALLVGVVILLGAIFLLLYRLRRTTSRRRRALPHV